MKKPVHIIKGYKDDLINFKNNIDFINQYHNEFEDNNCENSHIKYVKVRKILGKR